MESLEAQVRGNFERLKAGDFEITSNRDPQYNCIAWAMGKSDQFWWPDWDAVWPESAPRVVTVEAFTAAFATEGFAPCADGSPKQGVEKVALYTLNGRPTHAAFLLPDGKWGSKLGRDHDVHHLTLESIGGIAASSYGDATHFFERPQPKTPRPEMPNTQFEFAKSLGLINEAMGVAKKSKSKAAPQIKPKSRR